ncbi:MAG: DUF3887 domain-containing protein [Candidatus Thermoplasmatota archaeon]
MQRNICFTVVLGLILVGGALFSGCIQKPHPESKTSEEIALELVDSLNSGRYTEAHSLFNASVTAVMSVQQLQQIWASILQQYGTYLGVVGTRLANDAGYVVVYVTLNFSNTGALDLRLVFDDHNLIVGMQFVPAPTTHTYTAPEYVDLSMFDEVNVTVGSGEWALPGTMSIPKGSGPFPAVVLVQGSGSHDRDETVGPNKPFKDIAWGLASQGIVVLRYEKRTKQYPKQSVAVANFTVQDEVIDDVLAALDVLNVSPMVNHSRMFVLGHSLGGMLAPRIVMQDNRIAGLVFLAAPTRHLEDLYLEQMLYLSSLYTSVDENSSQLTAVKEVVQKIKTLNIRDGENVIGAPRSYWADLATYDPVSTAKNLSIPKLFLQGKRDYQVTMTDFNTWAATFAGDPLVTLKTYDALNHLFIPGTGVPTNTEYLIEGHVAGDVVADIGAWINAH